MGRNCSVHRDGRPLDPDMFDEFFESGMNENSSPFLTRGGRRWAHNLSLKSSTAAAVLLATSFGLSFRPDAEPIVHLLLVFVYFLAGIPALIHSLEDLGRLDINIDVLMTLAAFASVLIGSPMEGGLLLVLFDLAGAMEATVNARAVGALRSLKKLSPASANVIKEDGSIHLRALADIERGTSILVRAGEVIPLDGEVIDGASFVNLMHLTGENKPVSKQVGDTVPAGGHTIEGALTVRVTHNSGESTLARIIRLIHDAHDAKPRLEQWFDKMSRAYSLTIIGLSGVFAATLPFVLDLQWTGSDGAIYRSLAFLIAASPCALILAIPIAYLSSIGACARKGILLKGGVTLDALEACSVMAFDKTGTLTTGKLACRSIERVDGSEATDADQALAVASALERNATHPIARAISEHTEARRILPAKLTSFESIPGSGLKGTYQDLPVFIGRTGYIIEQLDKGKGAELRTRANALEASGDILAVLLIGEEVLIFRLMDTARTGVLETLQALRTEHGLTLMMLTGDHYESAKAVAEEVEIQDFQADLLPEDKLNLISKIADERGLAMVGDGINDAPALARATVGIAMGAVGSATAIEAADIVLLNDDIQHLSWLVAKAQATRRVIIQNLVLASAVIVLAATSALLGYIPLGAAVILHEGGTILVGLNGLRLLRS